MNYHAHKFIDVVEELKSNIDIGLSSSEVEKRTSKYGPNAMPTTKPKPWYLKLLSHFKDLLMLILLTASIFSFAIGELKDGSVIIAIVVANALMGYFQELKADNAIAALKKLSGSSAKVVRDGEPATIPADELVPGDIVIIENGDKVPADVRLLESVNLKISESSLTGESKPVEKKAEFVGVENLQPADRINMAYKDTLVVFGRGTAIVTQTGKHTEMGKIFTLLEKEEEGRSPLTRELKILGKGLTVFAGIAAVLVFGALFISTGGFKEAFLTAISMAIAVVPEGIPAVVTTVLAISASRLAKSNAIIRKMEAVETLGAATCILTDKTGTLTKNEMTVTDIILNENKISFNGGKFFENGNEIDTHDKEFQKIIIASVLCNDAKIESDGKIMGDPTEGCLLYSAMSAGINVEEIRLKYPRIQEIPFSSDTKLMSVAVMSPDKENVIVITKGAAESVAKYVNSGSEKIRALAEQLSLNGIRNLAFAQKIVSKESFMHEPESAFLENQEYIGTIGCKDPLREEAKIAIKEASEAGIRTVMITGDHKLIAKNIGTELGIVNSDEEIMDGAELAKIEHDKLPSLLSKIHAFSRVSPEQKLKIVKAAMAKGETVVVTGDGVNDAPAIKTADIGVAMGITGTDVAKEAADIVLADDNYATIVSAIRQGRSIFGNFIKFLKYQISCNLSGVLIVLLVTVISGTTPLLPVHILLLNLISETGPSIALGLEKPGKDSMRTKPRKKHERLLSKGRWARTVFEAIVLAGAGVGVFFFVHSIDPRAATTAVLVTAFLSRLWHALSSRSENHSIFSGTLERNMSLYYTIGATILALVVSVYTGIGNSIIKTIPLSPYILLSAIAISLVPLIVMEGYKAIYRAFNPG